MPPLILGSEPAWFRKRAEKEKMNKEIQVGQEEIPGPFLLPENIYNRKELGSFMPTFTENKTDRAYGRLIRDKTRRK